MLCAEEIDREVAPTIGFRNIHFNFSAYEVSLYDIGGGKNIRAVWKNYFAEIHGLIFVIDSSSRDCMQDAGQVFTECLQHPSITGKPVLL